MTKRMSFLLLFVLLATTVISCTAQPGGVAPQIVVTATPTARPEGAKVVLRVGTGDSGEGLDAPFQDHRAV